MNITTEDMGMNLSFSLQNCIRKGRKKKKKNQRLKIRELCLLIPQHLKCTPIEYRVSPKVRKWQRFSFRSTVAESKNYLLNKSLNSNQARQYLSIREERINCLESLQTEMTQKSEGTYNNKQVLARAQPQNLAHFNLVQYSILFSFKHNVNIFVLIHNVHIHNVVSFRALTGQSPQAVLQ